MYLNTPEDVERTVRYVEDNPVQAGLPSQRWDFVKPYDGWVPWKRW